MQSRKIVWPVDTPRVRTVVATAAFTPTRGVLPRSSWDDGRGLPCSNFRGNVFGADALAGPGQGSKVPFPCLDIISCRDHPILLSGYCSIIGPQLPTIRTIPSLLTGYLSIRRLNLAVSVSARW